MGKSRRASASEAIDQLSTLLRSHFVGTDEADALADELRARFDRGEYVNLDPALLAEALTNDLRSMSGDMHFSVTATSLTPVPSATQPEDRWKHAMPGADDNFGFRRVEVLDSGVGVVVLTSLSPVETGAATAHAAMRFLRHARSLVVDLRQCFGGDPDMIMLMASYLLGEQPVEMSSVTWRHTGRTDRYWTDPSTAEFLFGPEIPVYVVVGPWSASGAEALAYDLQAAGRVVVVGQTTLGAAHRIATFDIGSSLVATIPAGKVTNPITGADWETTGVTPSIKVDPGHNALEVACDLARANTALAGVSLGGSHDR